ncbi:hypothetical protein CR513_55758, partial [Mucuna pruriens]
MEANASFTTMPPLVFDGEGARMTTHLEALYLWETVEEDYELKNHKERKTKKATAKTCVPNLVRESDMQSMKEKNHQRLLSTVNKVQLLGKDFQDERIMQKKKKLSMYLKKESKDQSNITLGKLVYALQA